MFLHRCYIPLLLEFLHERLQKSDGINYLLNIYPFYLKITDMTRYNTLKKYIT